jgi:triosephosphate isomerase
MRRKMAAGNWKMNGTKAALSELTAVAEASSDLDVDVLVCPPAPLLSLAGDTSKTDTLMIGAQDCHSETSGAHTGDISASMIADVGATHVIVGHSERRANHGEDDVDVREKARTAQETGLVAIVCVGESEDQRLADNTLDIIGGQLAMSVPDAATAANIVIAYEPVWAIGTGRTPTTEQIDEVHDFMRMKLIERFGAEIGGDIRLLYGGSVKPGNAAEIFETDNVDGALVGGASLKADDFIPIIKALAASS